MKRILPLLLTLGSVTPLDLLEKELTGPGWLFWNQSVPSVKLPATTPSTFHLDLLANNQVPDPYYRDNLLQFYRFEFENWTYSSQFQIDDVFYSRQGMEIVFEGLDTHADIWLNGKTLLSTNNTHRTWIVDVTGMVAPLGSANNLTITFYSRYIPIGILIFHQIKSSVKAEAEISQNPQYLFQLLSREFLINSRVQLISRQFQQRYFKILGTPASIQPQDQNQLSLQKFALSQRYFIKVSVYDYSAVAHDLAAEKLMNTTYGIVLPANYSYSRKSAYHYGWDWGPRLVTAGIWKPIKLRAYDYLEIDSVLFRNDEVTYQM